MVFPRKWTFSSSVLLSKKSKKERFFDVLDRKERFLDLKSEVLKKSKKSTFCKGISPWFLSKNRALFHMFFLSQKSQKERFFDILDTKECFLDLKSEVSKKSKKSTFCKGVSPWFFSKNLFFFFFLWAKKSRKKHFFYILDRKECFLDQQRKVLKNSKESTFCKGVSSWFLSKNLPFPYIFFF